MKSDPSNELNRENLEYSEELYKEFLKNPSQVEDSWRWFFQGFQTGLQKFNSTSPTALQKELRVLNLFQKYREQGSLKAQLNPIEKDKNKGFPSLKEMGFNEEDLNKKFVVSENLFGITKPLKEVLKFLEEKYCQNIALKVENCKPEIKKWFFHEFEKTDFKLSKVEKIKAFTELSKAVSLEEFLQFRFLGKKRFSLEGLDVLIPMLDYLLDKGRSLEMKNLIIGMPHRGRINVLINVLKQNPKVIFSEFEGGNPQAPFDTKTFTRDVKYHLGFSSERQTKYGICSLYLGYNPSHLEVINPVVCGMSRAIQRKNQDTERRKTALPLLIHGDAAFCGQGSVSETLQLSQLDGYSTGGSLHIILNNQIGFTTEPKEARSNPFASDLAQSIQAPTLLVNADNPSSCLKAIDIALRFRYEFGSDVFIDLIGYRKHGHNEGDEPSFTQPLMYKKIKQKQSVLNNYKTELLEEKTLDKDSAEKIIKINQEYWEKHLTDLRNSKQTLSEKDYLGKSHLSSPLKPLKKTQIQEETLKELLDKLSSEPKDFLLHPKIKKILAKRRQAITSNQLDWSLCELIAYGSLIKEGFSIRLTGQDSKRGTFSHRHAVYYDYEKEQNFSPLKHFAKNHEKEFCLYNSPLSELAVLAFEYGNSCLAPDFLTLWEAQFGDFINGAQIILDQFISSGEFKWFQTTDIVLLLPHGYEGQGPEHSNAYLDRFLGLCAQNNMRICNFTKASNLFHALRKQKTLLSKRKPLIVMTPKSLLRHPEVVASKEDLTEGRFEEVLWDKDIQDSRDIETMILCTGKVYYDLKPVLEKKEKQNKKKKSAVFRLEQLYPFPEESLNPILNGFPCLSKIIWLQEEPKNKGAWTFIRENLAELIKKLGLRFEIEYKGREAMAASAEGSETIHKKEQERIILNCIKSI